MSIYQYSYRYQVLNYSRYYLDCNMICNALKNNVSFSLSLNILTLSNGDVSLILSFRDKKNDLMKRKVINIHLMMRTPNYITRLKVSVLYSSELAIASLVNKWKVSTTSILIMDYPACFFSCLQWLYVWSLIWLCVFHNLFMIKIEVVETETETNEKHEHGNLSDCT